ncbi:MAG: IMP cyclohydrolase [Nitrospirota bacterium]|nr:IMP cyclohydrolase [Nitrospirota bacterium]
MPRVRRTIVSVSDKTGIEEFVKTLNDLNVEILSTGGTAMKLREIGVPVVEVSDYTGFPEMLDGRVKTLHPRIHAGLLAKRDNQKHIDELKAQGIEPIDMVVVNLYPFEKTISKPDVTFQEAIENIDIGGPTMLRAAAKNFESVAVVVDPDDYDIIREEMIRLGGEISYKTRVRLAQKVFSHTSHYDSLIAKYLSDVIQESWADTSDF